MSAASLPFGYRIERHTRVTSTMDVARAAAIDGALEGLVVLADEQSAGRGRLGRTWHSPPGNLYASILLRPDLPLAHAGTLSLTAALSLAQAIEALTPRELSLKWPNDVLLDGAKVAGVILEAASLADGSCAHIIVGTGVNIAHAPDIPGVATTRLGEHGGSATRMALLNAYVHHLEAHLRRLSLEGFAAIKPEWQARAHPPGVRLRLSTEPEAASGRYLDVRDDGALLLQREDGSVRTVTGGEVQLVNTDHV